jgi:hypothetical protein
MFIRSFLLPVSANLTKRKRDQCVTYLTQTDGTQVCRSKPNMAKGGPVKQEEMATKRVNSSNSNHYYGQCWRFYWTFQPYGLYALNFYLQNFLNPYMSVLPQLSLSSRPTDKESGGQLNFTLCLSPFTLQQKHWVVAQCKSTCSQNSRIEIHKVLCCFQQCMEVAKVLTSDFHSWWDKCLELCLWLAVCQCVDHRCHRSVSHHSSICELILGASTDRATHRLGQSHSLPNVTWRRFLHPLFMNLQEINNTTCTLYFAHCKR